MITGTKNTQNASNNSTDAGRSESKPTIDILSQYRQKLGSGSDKEIHHSLLESFGERSKIKPRIIEGKTMAIEIDTLVFERVVGNDIVAAVFLIDSPDVNLGNTNEKVGGRDVSVPIVLGDIVHSENDYMDALTASMQDTYPDKNVMWSMVSVIPRLMLRNVSSATGLFPKDVIQKLWINIETSIVSLHNDIPLPVNALASDTRFVFRPEFPQDETASATGLPVFREWEILLRAQSDNKNISKAKINSNQIVSLSGHTDLVFCGDPMIENQGGIPRARTWEYNLHITQAKSELGYANLSTTLLALSSVPTLFTGTTRFVPLKRALHSKTRSLNALKHDLVDPQAQFDITEEDFTLNRWKDIYLFEDTKVILHVPECTEETTWLSMLESSASDPKMRNIVLDTARELCTLFDRHGNNIGNSFDEFWNENDVIGSIDTDDIVLNGYYTDENDVERDIVGWNYLAARTDIENSRLFQEYDNTFHDESVPLEIRLSERVRIIREQFPNVVFTGRSRPFRLSPAFLESLWAGVTKAMNGKYTIENTHELEGINQRSGHRHRGESGFNGSSFSFNNAGTIHKPAGSSAMRNFRS